MNAIIGKLHFILVAVFYTGCHVASSQIDLVTADSIYNLHLSATDKQRSLFETFNVLKKEYRITSTIKQLQRGHAGIINLELQLTTSSGAVHELRAISDLKIPDYLIKINKRTGQIVYAGVCESCDSTSISKELPLEKTATTLTNQTKALLSTVATRNTSTERSSDFICINAQQYLFEIYKSRTLIYDATHRNILTIEEELTDQPATGNVVINGSDCTYSYKNYILTLYNNQGEIVDVAGRAL